MPGSRCLSSWDRAGGLSSVSRSCPAASSPGCNATETTKCVVTQAAKARWKYGRPEGLVSPAVRGWCRGPGRLSHLIRVHMGCGPARRTTCGHPCPEQPEQVAVRELLKPCSLDAQPGTERRRCGGTDPPGAPGPCGPLGWPSDEPASPGQQRGTSGLGGARPPAQTSRFSQAPGVGSGKGRGPQEGRGLACEILSDCWGWGCFGATWRNSHTGGRCPGCGHPEITCPLGLTCLGPDGLQRQENILRRPALVREPRTSCDLAGVLGLCQLSKDGVPSLQACLGQRPFSGWRWGLPLRGGGLGGAGGRGHWEAHRSRGQTFSV